MEIKVISIQNTEGVKSSEMTSIFEGDEISHRLIFWKDKEDFHAKCVQLTKNIEGKFLGIENWMYEKEPNPRMPDGYFLYILYLKDNSPRCLICRHSEVYITNKGQTVDKVIIH